MRTGALHNSPEQKTLSKVSVKQPAMRNGEQRDLGNMEKDRDKNQSMSATIGTCIDTRKQQTNKHTT